MLMEDTYYEAYQDIESCKSECYCEKGWMRQMSGILPVCMQDFLHRWQPELRERKQIIITIVSVKLE